MISYISCIFSFEILGKDIEFGKPALYIETSADDLVLVSFSKYMNFCLGNLNEVWKSLSNSLQISASLCKTETVCVKICKSLKVCISVCESAHVCKSLCKPVYPVLTNTSYYR